VAAVADVRIDWRDVDRGFAEMARRADTVSTVFHALKRPARQDQEDHARRAMGPDGPWPRRSVATAMKSDDRSAKVRLSRRRNKKWAFDSKKSGAWSRGTQISTMTVRYAKAKGLLGTLPRSTVYSVRGGDELVAGVRRPDWAGAHNTGAVVGRGARLPRREFLWWSDRFLEVMTAAVEQHVMSGWDPQIRLSRLRLSL
jgi:hypothetical protein